MSASSPADRSNAGRAALGPDAWLIARWQWLAIAVALLATSSYVAFTQARRPTSARAPSAWTTVDWWLHPLEIDGELCLPAVDGDLLDVQCVPSTKDVWAVGRGGLVMRSEDDGETWEQVRVQVPRSDFDALRKHLEGGDDDDRRVMSEQSEPPESNKIYEPPRTGRQDAGPLQDSEDENVVSSERVDFTLDLALVQFIDAGHGCAIGTVEGIDLPTHVIVTGDRGSTWRLFPLLSAAGFERVLATLLDWRHEPGYATTRVANEIDQIDPLVAWRLSALAFRANMLVHALTDVEEAPELFAAAPGEGRSLHAIGHLSIRFPLDSKAEVLRRAITPLLNHFVATLGDAPAARVQGRGPTEVVAGDASMLSVPGSAAESWLWQIRVQPKSESAFDEGAGAVSAVHVVHGGHALIAFADGAIMRSTIDRPPWTACDAPSGLRPLAIELRDERVGWVVGERGTILASDDGFATWRARTRPPDAASAGATPSRYPAPWYYLIVAATLGLLVPVVRRPRDRELPTPSVADVLVTDKAIDATQADKLDFLPLARGVSRFLRNENTRPPLTVAITGPWGSGKSSLANLVRDDLRARGFRTVEFNAWHHHEEENLLGALLERIKHDAVPGLLSPAGLWFRAKLSLLRARRHKAAIAVGLVVLAFSGGYLIGNPTRRAQAADDLKSLVQQPLGTLVAAVEALSPQEDVDASTADGTKRETRVSLFLALLSGAGLLFGALKSLRTFGNEATGLIGALIGVFKPTDERDRAGPSRRFASEFAQVTAALAPQRLLIVIDDLDRCQPDKILRMLEAVNFVVGAGECFVILAIERERVESGVAQGYQGVVEELAADETDDRAGTELRRRFTVKLDRAELARGLEGAVEELEPVDRSAADERDARRRYAQHYLEKLINIEIAVPRPDAERLASLYRGESAEDRKLVRARARRSLLLARFRQAALVVAVVAATIGAYRYGSGVGANGAAAAQGSVVDGETTREGGSAGPQSGGEPQAGDVEPSARIGELVIPPPARFVEGLTIERRFGLAPWIALAALVVALWRLRIRAETVVHDSEDFTRALAIWQPVALASNPTPRALKRFVNRVRYLAMLQRGPEEPVSWTETTWRSLLGLATRMLGALNVPRSLVEGPIPDLRDLIVVEREPSKIVERLDDHDLVALSLVERIDKRVDAFGEALPNHPRAPLEIERALSEHRSAFGGGDPLAPDKRELFARLNAGVRTD